MQEDVRAKIIAKCWKDPAFKKKFLANPMECLKEMGLELPKGIKVKAIEDQKDQFTFVIPQKPVDSEELSEKELEKIAAGWEDLCGRYTRG
jgi:hypothetical protein